MTKSEAAITQKAAEIEELQKKLESCGQTIEMQQKSPVGAGEEAGTSVSLQNPGRRVKAHSDRKRPHPGEIASIDLALETMTSLSSSIRDSFGLYLIKQPLT